MTQRIELEVVTPERAGLRLRLSSMPCQLLVESLRRGGDLA